MSMAIALSGGRQGQRYTPAELTRAGGFTGVDGAFRLLPTAATERALAILEVQKFGAGVIDAAPALPTRGPRRRRRPYRRLSALFNRTDAASPTCESGGSPRSRV